MSNITRSEYQKVCEENKRLKKDIEALARLDKNAMELLMEWRAISIEKEKTNDLIKESCINFIVKYSHDIPDYLKKNKKRIHEVVDCECGHEAPIGFAVCNEDGNWTCANCIIEHAKEKN